MYNDKNVRDNRFWWEKLVEKLKRGLLIGATILTFGAIVNRNEIKSYFVSKSESSDDKIKNIDEIMRTCELIEKEFNDPEIINTLIDQLEKEIESFDTDGQKQIHYDILEIARLFCNGGIRINTSTYMLSDEREIQYSVEGDNESKNSFIITDEHNNQEIDIQSFKDSIQELFKDENGLVPKELEEFYTTILQTENANQITQDILKAMIIYLMSKFKIKIDDIPSINNIEIGMSSDLSNLGHSNTNNPEDFRNRNKISYSIEGVKFKPGDEINIKSYPANFQKPRITSDGNSEKIKTPYKDKKGEMYKKRFEDENGVNICM